MLIMEQETSVYLEGVVSIAGYFLFTLLLILFLLLESLIILDFLV
jgi:hypothetical protein